MFDHTGTEEGIAQQEMRGLFGLGGEGNLREIVSARVGIEFGFAFLVGASRSVGGCGRGVAGQLRGIVPQSRFEGIAAQTLGRQTVAAGVDEGFEAVFCGIVVTFCLVVGE